MVEKIVVSNSTPIINFATIDRMDILHALYGKIVIPEAVWDEVVVKGVNHAASPKIKKIEWIQRRQVSEDNFLKMLKTKLDNGEAEAIALSIENKADLVLLDEKSARDVARTMSLNFMGTIGCLLLARKLGIIGNIRPILDKIITEAKFWISRALYEMLLSGDTK
jgi:predicted nucleic acid-binding protein